MADYSVQAASLQTTLRTDALIYHQLWRRPEYHPPLVILLHDNYSGAQCTCGKSIAVQEAVHGNRSALFC